MKPALTTQEREQVRMFSLAGMRQKMICREVGLSKHLVRKVQREHNLLPYAAIGRLPPAISARILELLRQGHGSPFIARALGLPGHKVREVMREHSFRRPPGQTGCRYKLSAEKKRAIRRAFREFEKRIAREFGVSTRWVERFWRRQR